MPANNLFPLQGQLAIAQGKVSGWRASLDDLVRRRQELLDTIQQGAAPDDVATTLASLDATYGSYSQQLQVAEAELRQVQAAIAIQN